MRTVVIPKYRRSWFRRDTHHSIPNDSVYSYHVSLGFKHVSIPPQHTSTHINTQEWATHEQFGHEFQSIASSILEEFGEAPQEDTRAEAETPARKTRKRGGEAMPVPTPKRLKVENDKISLASDIGLDNKLLDVPLLNTKVTGVSVHVKIGNKVYLMNKSAQEINLKRGLVICGFGKGKWKQRADEEDWDRNKEIGLILTSASEAISKERSAFLTHRLIRQPFLTSFLPSINITRKCMAEGDLAERGAHYGRPSGDRSTCVAAGREDRVPRAAACAHPRQPRPLRAEALAPGGDHLL